MISTEAFALTRYVKALCPQQKFDDYTPDAWHDVLSGYTLEEARNAAAAVARRQPFVSPGEIATEIHKNRRRLMELDAETEPPTTNPDDVTGYLAQMRRHRYSVATGQTPVTRAITAAVNTDDIRAMRQQKDLAAFIKQASAEAKQRCDERVRLVGRHPDLRERVDKILGRPNWNGYVGPEHDCTGRINDSPVRRRLVEVLEEAQQREAMAA